MRNMFLLLFAAGALVAAAPAVAATPTTNLTLVVGKKGVSGGPKKFTVKKGAHVRLSVTSAIGEDLHLHGYDIEKEIVSHTKPAVFLFTAKVAGVFELELHLHGGNELKVATLTVR